MRKLYRDVKSDTTYLLCPDKTCTLFTKPTPIIPCEHGCPHQDKLIKIVKCPCGELVELYGYHSQMQRVDHCCKNGNMGSTFARMSGKYERIFERPVKS
jgi:hypothetical protein